MIVLGTAGHVDHGKTSLVRALTGMDTDRLPEEKARGISIELGIAWLDRPSGRFALIDVPGHERFVRQMVAGAVGMDGVLFVVAADEGVMPQTREHLDICRLLGIERGVIVLTRIDKAEPGLADLAAAEIRELTADTFLADAELVPFSIHDPATRDAVIAAIDRTFGIELMTLGGPLVAETTPRSRADRPERVDRPFCMTVDRSFSRPGFGTIAAGTSATGVLALEDELAIHVPGVAPRFARVRGLEHHGDGVSAIGPGRRVAVNLAGVSLDEVPRGARLTPRASPLVSTSWLEVILEARADLQVPIADGERGLAHFGATTIEASVHLRGGLEAGARRVAILRLASPLLLVPGERWIFRGFRRDATFGATLGGGLAMTPAVGRRRLLAFDDPHELDQLDAVDPGDGSAVDDPASRGQLGRWAPWARRAVRASSERALVHAAVEASGEHGATLTGLEGSLPISRAGLGRAVDELIAQGRIARAGALFVGCRTLDHLGQATLAKLRAMHDEAPDRPGIPLDALRARVRPDGVDAVFVAAVDALVRRSLVVRLAEGSARDPRLSGAVRLPEFAPRLGDDALDQKVADALDSAELAPPDPEVLAAALQVSLPEITGAINRLVPRGVLTRVAGADRGLVFATTSLQRFEARVRDHFTREPWLDAQQLKALSATTRKWAIPLGEWLDKRGVTVRVGDKRRLRNP